MTIEARDRLIPNWFARIKARQIVLPRFQRFEAWSHANVTQMFNTILQQLPLGAVLVLEIGEEEPFVSRPIVGAPDDGDKIVEHLLDGQQRLTALWRGLHNDYEKRTYFLYLKKDDETGAEFYVNSIGRWRNSSSNSMRPLWADNPRQLWDRRMIPLDLCKPDDDVTAERYKQWSRKAIADSDEREDVTQILNKVRGIFATFNLPYLSLPARTQKETALDVFIKMNTSAAPLKTYDVVVAQVEGATGQSLHELVGACREACPGVEKYYDPEELVLYASALLQRKEPTNSTYLTASFGENLLNHWDKLVVGLQSAVAFLAEERIFDAKRLPSDVVVPVLTALLAEAPQVRDAGGRARTRLRQYLWRAFFSDRYSMSTNSRALADCLALRALIKNTNAPLPLIFVDEQYPLPSTDELMVARWPKNKDRLGRAVLALALREGGRDLADGSNVGPDNLPKREYHHLFPRAILARQGLDDDKIYRSLNCALIAWQTNRDISDKKPERYLAERRDKALLGEADLRERLSSHLIPYDEMVAGDYDVFLERRADMIHEQMLQLCGLNPEAWRNTQKDYDTF